MFAEWLAEVLRLHDDVVAAQAADREPAMTTQGPYRASIIPESLDEDYISPKWEIVEGAYGALEGHIFVELVAKEVAALMNAAHARGRAEAGAEVEAMRKALQRLQDGPTEAPYTGLTGDWLKGFNCGIEDRGLQGDAYEAGSHGYNYGLERMQEWINGEVDAALSRTEGMVKP